jgi:hypothetical protein
MVMAGYCTIIAGYTPSNGRLLWKTNGREKPSSISNSIINKDILRDLWKMEEVLYFFLVIYCPASA